MAMSETAVSARVKASAEMERIRCVRFLPLCQGSGGAEREKRKRRPKVKEEKVAVSFYVFFFFTSSAEGGRATVACVEGRIDEDSY